jgi:UPF0755 protein
MQMLSNEYRIDRPKRSGRNTIFLLLTLILVTGLVMVIYYFTKVNRAATDDSHEVVFVVEKGSNTRAIASNLDEQDIISNKNIFIIYVKLHDAGNKIQAGEYVLNSNMTIAEIVDVLTLGKVSSQSARVTLIEGKTNDQIAQELEKKNVAAARDFLLAITDDAYTFKYKDFGIKFNYQGFLFPDTYQFAKDVTVKEVVQKMLTNFESKFTDKMLGDIEKQNRTLGDAIILASIIEKEVGRNKENITAADIEKMKQERRNVASVFYNRLEIGMGLESDATVNYITGKSDRSVSIEDTKINSPYNTYRVKGLPPTPISNPGLDSIMAAIYPADTNYLFFLNSPDGTAYYATTLAGHNENREKYLR